MRLGVKTGKGTVILLVVLTLGILWGLFASAAAEAAVWYVKANAAGANNGTSWANAYTNLQSALSAAASGDQIWVASSVYTPGTNRTATFQLKTGVAVYGGFTSAGSPTFADRNPAVYPTILSGDIDGNDNQWPVITDILTAGGNSTNSYHVVTGASGATLDGFTITAGYANGTDPYDRGGGMYNNNSSQTVTNVKFRGNLAVNGGGMYNGNSNSIITQVTFSSNQATADGGGMFNDAGSPRLTDVTFYRNNTMNGHGGGMRNSQSSPEVTNVTFSENWAEWGAGVHNYQGSPVFTNITFYLNTADDNGGGMGNEQSSPTITNATFNNNLAVNRGAGMDNYNNSNPQVRNTIFWGDSAAANPEISNVVSSIPVVSFSVVQGGYGGAGNLSTDPMLGTFGDHGGPTQTIPILSGSSAINSGNPAYCTLGTDQRGVSYSGVCDIGAYEYYNVLYAKPAAGGAGTCRDWTNACTLETALTNAAFGDEIWVAAGTHKPTSGNDRNATFQLKSGVAIYGGFDGTETAHDQRNPATNIVILSGDLNGNDNGNVSFDEPTRADNSYHVVTGATGATVDGVTISGGNANGNSCPGTTCGGGMLNYSSSPTLTNVSFSGNSAYFSGGGIYNWVCSPMLTNVTFSGNSASWYGGGIYDELSSPTLTNVTFSGNSSNIGGGMANFSGSSPTLTNVTFSGNSATTGGGMQNGEGNPQVRNSIFWGNSGGEIGNYISGAPTVIDSVVQGGCPSGSSCTNIITDDPLLGTLGSYGGGMQTVPLLPGSPAIKATGTNCPSADQRGIARGPMCDIGAFESQGFTLTKTGGDNQAILPNSVFDQPLSLSVTSAYAEPVDGGQVVLTAPASGASLSITPITLTIAGGAVSQTVTANGVPGTYNVTAGANGATSVTFALTNSLPAILYARPGGLTSGACERWSNACELSYALGGAVSGQEIWVASGTYKPTGGSDRNATFQLKNSVAIYGGFPDTGDPAFIDRNPGVNLTILSGDLNGDDNGNVRHDEPTRSDNSYHVVTGATGATLDGVTITGGNANAVSGSCPGDALCGGGMMNDNANPTLTGVTFSGNSAKYGGGMSNNGGSPTLTGVTFSGNFGTTGGAMYNNVSSLTLTNSTFSGNISDWRGGGIFNYVSSPTLTNVTLSGNSAPMGGGMFNSTGSTPQVNNSIFWGNTGGEIVNDSSASSVTNSVVQGGYAGTGNISDDPMLGALGNYGGSTQTIPLLPGSSAIDAGNATTCAGLSGGNKDQRDKARLGTCDIGAFESQGFTLTKAGGDNQSAVINTVFGALLGVMVTSDATPAEPVDDGAVTFSGPSSGSGISPISVAASISGGSASVSVTANGTFGGPYNVTASATGADGVNFSLTNILDGVSVIVIDPSTPSKLYAGVDARGIYKSADNGSIWTPASTQPANKLISGLVMNPANHTVLYAATLGGGIVKSSDSGDTWASCTNTGLGSLNATSLAIDPTGKLYAGTEAGIFTSTDCDTWSTTDGSLPASAGTPPVSIAIDPTTTSKVYAGLNGAGVYRSANSGGTWTAATTQPTNLRVKALVIKPGDSAKLYAATYGSGVFMSVNSGDTWSQCTNTNLANLNAVSLVIDPGGKIYAGTEDGVFVSNDNCASWTAMNAGLPN